MKDFKLYDMDSNEFYKLIDSTRVELKKHNDGYRKISGKLHKIMDKYTNLQLLLEDEKIVELNTEECKKLQEIVSLGMQLRAYEEQQIFFLGARENYFYMQNLGLIKVWVYKKAVSTPMFFLYNASNVFVLKPQIQLKDGINPKPYLKLRKRDERFYEFLHQLRGMATNLNQMAKIYNENYGYVNTSKYKTMLDEIESFILGLNEVYVLPKKIGGTNGNNKSMEI